MSLPPQSSPERQQLAAEFALGVLAGDELVEARALCRENEAFASEVSRWRARLAPLLDEIDPVPPPAHLWPAIQQKIGRARGAESNVVALRRKLRIWRRVAGGAAAIAAALALVLLIPRQAVQPPPAAPSVRPALLVAVLGDEQQPTKLVASWDPAARQLIVAGAAGLAAEPRRSHELWVIPADGTPRSLGTIANLTTTHVTVAAPVARQLQSGATLAVSVEPEGGSPTGSPTGPVIASGKLERV